MNGNIQGIDKKIYNMIKSVMNEEKNNKTEKSVQTSEIIKTVVELKNKIDAKDQEIENLKKELVEIKKTSNNSNTSKIKVLDLKDGINSTKFTDKKIIPQILKEHKNFIIYLHSSTTGEGIKGSTAFSVKVVINKKYKINKNETGKPEYVYRYSQIQSIDYESYSTKLIIDVNESLNSISFVLENTGTANDNIESIYVEVLSD